MNELKTQSKQLPDTLEDLSKFVLVGREKLNAVRAEIRAIQKVGLAKEVHEQKLAEAQEIAEAVLDAEAKLGELTAQMEKSVGGRPSETKDTNVHSLSETKAQQLEQIGITEKQKQRFESLAKHPEVVEQAKADARAEGRIVTRADVLNRIAPPKSHDQSVREFKKQAREEHEEFKQAKQESVVDFEDIQKDKQNQEIINLDNKITIQKVISNVNSLRLLSDEEITEMVKTMSYFDKGNMQRSLRESIKILIHVSNIIGD